LNGLRERGIAPDPASAHLEVASRTDRGVSARANVLAIRSVLPEVALLHRLNAIAPELFFTAVAPASPAFRVRRALRRTYRYFEPGPLSGGAGLDRATRIFEGLVDVRSFGRALPSREPVYRTVESLNVTAVGGGRRIEVRAPSFVWGMVRKIVGALREVEAGRLTLSQLEAAIAGRERLTLPMAEPEGLVLWDVEYDGLDWPTKWPGANRHQERLARRTQTSVWQRASVLRELWGPVSPE